MNPRTLDSVTERPCTRTRYHFWLKPFSIAGALLVAISAASAEESIKYPLYGLNFSPYMDGQDPTDHATVTRRQLRERMQIIAPYTRWIRTYGSTHGEEEAGRIAHKMGLKAAIGARLGPADSAEQIAANEAEIDSLIARGQKGQVNLAIVGSHVLLRGELSPEQLLNYIHRVKAALPYKRVAYADIYEQLIAHPEILKAVDVVLFSHHGYWAGFDVKDAIPALDVLYRQVVTAAEGKPVMIAETGWPTCGEAFGEAVPSLENANLYFQNFVSWARTNKVKYFYFEAFDESWKAAHEGPQGACWGLWDKEGQLKPGMVKPFRERRITSQ